MAVCNIKHVHDYPVTSSYDGTSLGTTMSTIPMVFISSQVVDHTIVTIPLDGASIVMSDISSEKSIVQGTVITMYENSTTIFSSGVIDKVSTNNIGEITDNIQSSTRSIITVKINGTILKSGICDVAIITSQEDCTTLNYIMA